MELIILRHGETGNRARGLTASGRKKMEDAANSINDLKLQIHKIVTSPLTNARETAEIVARVLNKQRISRIWDELKPEAETADLYRRLSKFKGESSILLVGHEPYLSNMISELISGGKRSRILLKKGGMAKVVIDSLAPKTSDELRWLLTPRQIKKIS